MLAPSRLIASLAIAVSAASLSFVTSTAQAAAPTPKTFKITTGPFSIGGLKLGDSYADAHAAWGTGDDCSEADAAYKQRTGEDLDRSQRPGSCYFSIEDAGESDSGGPGSAELDFEGGKVSRIVLNSAQNAKYKAIPTGPMARFKLPKKGIGLGSSMKSLFKAYPKLKRSGNGYSLKSGKQELIFVAQLSELNVIQLQ